MELALIFVWTTMTNFWGKWGKLTKMTFKWLGELVMAGYKKVISMADLTSWQARYLSEFAPHSWTETYRSIIHEFHALIFTLYSPLSFFFKKRDELFFYPKSATAETDSFSRHWKFFIYLQLYLYICSCIWGLLTLVQSCSRTTSLK